MKPTKIHRIAAVLLALALGLFLGYSAGEYEYRSGAVPQPSVPGESVAPARTFSLMLDYGDGKLATFQGIPFTQGESLLSALQRKLADAKIDFASKDYGSLGALVTKIGDRENGTGNRYWQYWVNNRHADVGAGGYIVKPDDVVEWKFTTNQGE